MNLHVVLIAIGLLSFTYGQEEITPDEYLTKLNFTLREEKIPEIINYLLNDGVIKHDIKTQDIIQLSKLDQCNLEETLQIFRYFNKTVNATSSINCLEIVLDSLDVKFSDFYKNLTQKLNLADTTVQQVLGDLSIDGIGFLMAIVSDSYVYDILRNGSYEKTNLDAALNTMGKTENDVFRTSKEIILGTILQMNSTDFMNILHKNGWSKELFSDLWKALNITTRDVYEVIKFRNIFTAISDSLNRNLTLAVFIGSNRLAIHEKVYKQFDAIVDGVTVKVETNHLEVEIKPSKRLGKSILELTTKEEGNKYVEITDCYNATANCFYSTFIGNEINTERVEIDSSFNVEKSENVIFNLGSPLFCEGRLFGLAREENNNTIFFDKFYTEIDNIPNNNENHGSESHGVAIHFRLQMVPILCFLFVSYYCNKKLLL